MYADFSEVYRKFKESGAADPLAETLRLIDVLSSGALRGSDMSILESRGLSIESIIESRKDGIPLEYILGEAPFMGRLLYCASGALIPRHETELLTSTCISIAAGYPGDSLTVIELGTGSGNIAVSIALAETRARVFAADLSCEAVEVARRNVERFGLAGRVSLFCGDLFEPMREAGLEGGADIVVCNPPYIPTGSLERLAAEIIDHEPVVALDAGAYGIDIFRRLIKESPDFLRPGGTLAFEIGAGQDRLVARLFKKSGTWQEIGTFDDGNAVRVFTARKL